MKTMPRVPTQAMNDAYIAEVFAATDDGCASLEAHIRAYRKMYEAAPEAPALEPLQPGFTAHIAQSAGRRFGAKQ